MPSALTYRRSGYTPVYSLYVEIELPHPYEPKVHVTRYREERYVSGGGCGSCGYQTPIHVYQSVVSRTQPVSGTQVQVGRWVYQFADIRPDDQVRIERHEANALQEHIVYTAIHTGFTTASLGSSSYTDSLQIALVDGDQPARHTLRGQHWWQQSEGVLHVRNGFAMQGMIAVPIPQIAGSRQSLLQAVTDRPVVKEPVFLN